MFILDAPSIGKTFVGQHSPLNNLFHQVQNNELNQPETFPFCKGENKKILAGPKQQAFPLTLRQKGYFQEGKIHNASIVCPDC